MVIAAHPFAGAYGQRTVIQFMMMNSRPTSDEIHNYFHPKFSILAIFKILQISFLFSHLYRNKSLESKYSKIPNTKEKKSIKDRKKCLIH
jgi:hypothetical protein